MNENLKSLYKKKNDYTTQRNIYGMRNRAEKRIGNLGPSIARRTSPKST